jgi:hypothetical protein
MDKFLEVIRGIDWDLLHEQKHEVLHVVEDQEKIFGKTGELMGLVNLIDEFQDVAMKLKLWKFPFDGDCPECGGRNYSEMEFSHGSYECYDCGNIFSIIK